MAIKLKLEGFEEFLKDIEEAGGSVDKATESAVRQSAQIFQAELKSEMKSSDLSPRLADRMPPFTIEKSGNKTTARVGFKETPYHPKELSDYYKAIFANYGTPHRQKHGHEKARGFIQKAKRRARPKMKKQQKIALMKILERLKR